MERHKKYSWFKNAMIKCENNALEVNGIDEMFDVYLDYCNPIEHSMNLDKKIEQLQAQLEKAESILATLRTSESSTTMKSNCWQQSVEYFKEKNK